MLAAAAAATQAASAVAPPPSPPSVPLGLLGRPITDHPGVRDDYIVMIAVVVLMVLVILYTAHLMIHSGLKTRRRVRQEIGPPRDVNPYAASLHGGTECGSGSLDGTGSSAAQGTDAG